MARLHINFIHFGSFHIILLSIKSLTIPNFGLFIQVPIYTKLCSQRALHRMQCLVISHAIVKGENPSISMVPKTLNHIVYFNYFLKILMDSIPSLLHPYSHSAPSQSYLSMLRLQVWFDPMPQVHSLPNPRSIDSLNVLVYCT